MGSGVRRQRVNAGIWSGKVVRRTAMVRLIGCRFRTMHIVGENASAGEAADPGTARVWFVGAGFYLGQHDRVARPVHNLADCLSFVNQSTWENPHALGVLGTDIRNIVAFAKT